MSSPQQTTSLPDYLKPFIYQSASSIQQQLDLRSLGLQTLNQPQNQHNQLVYTVIRPVRIPIPIAQSAEMVPEHSHSKQAMASHIFNSNAKLFLSWISSRLPAPSVMKVKPVNSFQYKKRSPCCVFYWL
ncbi:MAG: hypothetical protein U1F01_00560 [Acinetobacter sp.]